MEAIQRRMFKTVETTGWWSVSPPIGSLLTITHDLVALLAIFGQSHLLLYIIHQSSGNDFYFKKNLVSVN